MARPRAASGEAGVTPIAQPEANTAVTVDLGLPEIDPISGVRLPTMSDVRRAQAVVQQTLPYLPMLSTPASSAR